MDTRQEREWLRYEARREALHPSPLWDAHEANCGNCVHWDTRAGTRLGLPAHLDLAPCARQALVLDGAGTGGIVLLSPDNHCRSHAEAFEPCRAFLLELADRARPAA